MLSLNQRDMILESLCANLARLQTTFYSSKSIEHKEILRVKINEYKALIELVRSKL